MQKKNIQASNGPQGPLTETLKKCKIIAQLSDEKQGPLTRNSTKLQKKNIQASHETQGPLTET